MANNITNVDNWLIDAVVLYMMLFLETSNIGDNIWQMAPDSISRDVEAVHTASNVLISHLPGCAKTKKIRPYFVLKEGNNTCESHFDNCFYFGEKKFRIYASGNVRKRVFASSQILKNAFNPFSVSNALFFVKHMPMHVLYVYRTWSWQGMVISRKRQSRFKQKNFSVN